jgi:cell division protein FtsX
MGESGLFFSLTVEPKNQQFIHAALSKLHDLNQFYTVIKKNNMKQNSLKKIVNRLRLCIVAFVLTMLSLLLFLFNTGIK